VNISCNLRFITVSCGGKKTFIVAKNRRTILPKRKVLKGDNMRRTFNLGKKTKKILKNITATKTILLNDGNI